jgi:hypothetical protein
MTPLPQILQITRIIVFVYYSTWAEFHPTKVLIQNHPCFHPTILKILL